MGHTHTLPRAVLFDWDNTLVDTWPVIVEALNMTFEAMGRERWSLDDIKSGRDGIHQSLRNSFPRLFGERWEEARDLYLGAFLDCHLDILKPLHGARKTLEALHTAEVPMAIVSNKTGKHLRTEVAHLGWDHLFGRVVGPTDLAEDKPSPVPVHAALETLARTPNNDVWMVGDSHTDIEVALNAGITPILFGDTPLDDAVRNDARHTSTLTHVENHDILQSALGVS